MFVDVSFTPLDKTVSGFTLTNPSAMVLSVATGTITLSHSGLSLALQSSVSHTFTADATHDRYIYMGLIHAYGNLDVWIDNVLLDGTRCPRAPVPNGFVLAHDLAWFTLPAGTTDLVGVSINRRVIV